MTALAVAYRPVADLAPYARNARTHSADQVGQLAAAILEFGWTNPVLADAQGIVAGHGRVLAARKLYAEGHTLRRPNGEPIPPGCVPTIDCSGWTEAARRAYILADNKLAQNAGWDDALLISELEVLKSSDFVLSVIGFSDDELAAMLGGGASSSSGSSAGSLTEKFMLAPFSVLNARDGWWQERKRAWLSLGIRSELGRDAAPGGSPMVSGYSASGERLTGTAASESGTSVFDPVLCELAYRWFSPPGGLVLDPFAGGSVRGIVAAKLGRRYVGLELRAEQVEANREQGASICAGAEHPPAWIAGDSRRIDEACATVEADMLFSCPPYADLERYSDDPADLSTMPYSDFLAAYREIIAKACARLAPASFACFVVGEIRDRKGNYRDFVGDTVQAFRDAGLSFYNEAILITAVGSLPIRVGKQFSSSRKLGKTHQNVLVFCKGDGARAAARCGEVEIDASLFAPEAETAREGGDGEEGRYGVPL
jgi:hypothetical protein